MNHFARPDALKAILMPLMTTGLLIAMLQYASGENINMTMRQSIEIRLSGILSLPQFAYATWKMLPPLPTLTVEMFEKMDREGVKPVEFVLEPGEVSPDGKQLLMVAANNGASSRESNVAYYNFDKQYHCYITDEKKKKYAVIPIYSAHWDPTDSNYIIYSYCRSNTMVEESGAETANGIWRIDVRDNQRQLLIGGNYLFANPTADGKWIPISDTKDIWHFVSRRNLKDRIDIQTPICFNPSTQSCLSPDRKFANEYGKIQNLASKRTAFLFETAQVFFSDPQISQDFGLSNTYSGWLPDSSGLIYNVNINGFYNPNTDTIELKHQLWLVSITGKVTLLNTVGAELIGTSLNGRQWLFRLDKKQHVLVSIPTKTE